jgi:hypothetical protein
MEPATCRFLVARSAMPAIVAVPPCTLFVRWNRHELRDFLQSRTRPRVRPAYTADAVWPRATCFPAGHYPDTLRGTP